MAKSAPIMLAVDFSDASAAAHRRRTDLAMRRDARLVLVHAFSPPPRAPSLVASVHEGPYLPVLEAEAEMQPEEAHQLTERWAQPMRDQGLDVEVIAKPGPATDVILAAAKEVQPEMIIMGRQGHGSLRRMVMGAQSRYVSEHSTFPALLVPS